MKSFKRTLFVLIVLLVAGCGTYRWVNNGAVNSFDRDKYECERESEQMARQVEIDREERAPTKCNAYSDGAGRVYANCYKSSGYSSKGAALLGGLSQGLKKGNNFRACMKSKGWMRVRVDENKYNEFGSSDFSMECQTNEDCRQGESCRSKKGGGTECRTRIYSP